MSDAGRVEDLQAQLSELDRSIANAAEMTAAFDGELRRMKSALSEAGKDMQAFERGLSRGLRRAFDGVVFDGQSLGSALRGAAGSVAGSAYSAAVNPIAGKIGSSLMQAIMPFAKGGAISQGRVRAFASGGVVSSPTYFPMQNGLGLMGEAGPEAILPLSRGSDGRLGVRSSGGSKPVNVVFNISTPDVEGFSRSQSQISAHMSRVLSRGQRNL